MFSGQANGRTITRGRDRINETCQRKEQPSEVQLKRPKDATERGRNYASVWKADGFIVELDGIVSCAG
jgi:hypothetical protein